MQEWIIVILLGVLSVLIIIWGYQRAEKLDRDMAELQEKHDRDDITEAR